MDLVEEAKMSAEEVEALAKKLKLRLYRTSVKMNFNVDAGGCVCNGVHNDTIIVFVSIF